MPRTQGYQHIVRPRKRGASAITIALAAWVFSPIAIAQGAPQVLGPAAAQGEASTASLDWYDDILKLIREVYIILGGDPKNLDSVSEVEEMMRIVRDHYYAYGVPQNLSDPERQEAIATVDETYALSTQAPPDVNPNEVALFQEALTAMRSDLAAPN